MIDPFGNRIGAAPMQRIDVNRPMNLAQMAQLYADGPAQGGSQVQGFLNDQGHRLGIGDPTNYFAGQRQDASNMAAAAASRQSQLEQLAGIDNSPRAQYLHQIDQASAMAAHANETQRLAALQNADRSNPLPMAGQAPQLSDTQQLDMQQRGITSPLAYTLNARLGSNTNFTGGGNVLNALTSRNAAGVGSLDPTPDNVFNHAAFQREYQANPQRAAEIFQSLTGGSLLGHHVAGKMAAGGADPTTLDPAEQGGYLPNLLARRKATTDTGLSHLRKGVEEGWLVQPSGDQHEFQVRGWAPDANGKMARTGAPEPLDLYSKGVIDNPDVLRKFYGDKTAEAISLARLGPPTAGLGNVPVAGVQPQQSQEEDPFARFGQSGTGINRAVGDWMQAGHLTSDPFNAMLGDAAQGMRDTVNNAGVGLLNAGRYTTNALGLTNSPMGLGTAPNDPHLNWNQKPQVSQGAHARQMAVVNTPEFRALQQRDPASARRIVARLQGL